jgi:hypothetical protein
VGVAAVLGLYMVGVESKKEAPKDTKDVEVWSLTENQAKDLKTLVFTSGTASATYNRDGDTWRYANDPKRDITPGTWDTAYNNLKTLMATRKVEEKPSDLAKYGLKDPAASIRWGDEKTPYMVKIGEKSPTGDAYFMHTTKDDTVYTVSSWKVDEWKTLATKPPLEPLPTPTPAPSASVAPGHSTAPGAAPTPTPDPNARPSRPSRPARESRPVRQ